MGSRGLRVGNSGWMSLRILEVRVEYIVRGGFCVLDCDDTLGGVMFTTRALYGRPSEVYDSRLLYAIGRS